MAKGIAAAPTQNNGRMHIPYRTLVKKLQEVLIITGTHSMRCFLNRFLNQMQSEHSLAERWSLLISYAVSHWVNRTSTDSSTFLFPQQYHKIPASFQSFKARKNKQTSANLPNFQWSPTSNSHNAAQLHCGTVRGKGSPRSLLPVCKPTATLPISNTPLKDGWKPTLCYDPIWRASVKQFQLVLKAFVHGHVAMHPRDSLICRPDVSQK